MNFKKINNLSGWLIFAIAYITYLMTMERTASLWDCGEFLSAAYKLEVAHSPGAPLFMILGRMFGVLASDPTSVAMFINSMSALMSAFTILFLFWSITHFARKIVVGNTYVDISGLDTTKIISAGVIGALAYTFSDTFWFSAVEAEVYATSSFFTAIVFWQALKWEAAADKPKADKWLVLIFFMIGLSVGVHLLNLLAIPAITLIYYFKRYKPTFTGSIIAFIVGCVILGLVQFGIIQYLPIIASNFELLFTNSFGMPFNTGFFVFLIVLIAVIIGLLMYAKRKNKYMVHLATLCFTFATIGYSSYVTVVIRSKADVPIDMTNPDNLMSLIPYLQRDQYGSQPLFSGPYFDSRVVDIKNARNTYMPTLVDGKDQYVLVDFKPKYVFDKNYFFPRIWGFMDPNHAQFYRSYLGLGKNESPTFADNMKFFMGYQINWMYWRYFMWNYVGRQNDIAGQGEPQHGNWISGIKFIDKMFGKGDADLLPNYLKNNKARNELYFLPFILGLLGVFYHYKRDKNDFAVVALFFFFTGIAIQLYINNTPMQPRERDYAYVSTYAFAIWIGLGVIYFSDLLNKFIKKPALSVQLAAVVSLVAVPILMAAEEWDDHDRSQKTIARDHARNVLISLDSNSIVITYGDNDTYPLWYIQEVEEFRTDIRIFNHNLLGTDWQNEQMFNKINKADAIPVIWDKAAFFGKNLNQALFYDHPKLNKNTYYDAEEIIKYISNPANKLPSNRGGDDSVNIIPTRNISIKVNKDAYIKNFNLNEEQAARVEDVVYMNFKDQNSLTRADLSLMNIIAGLAKDGFKRSIYMSDNVPNLGLDKYFKPDGTLNKFTPMRPTALAQQYGIFDYEDLDRNIKLFTEVYDFGTASKDHVYYDEKNRLIFMTYRNKASFLAYTLTIANRKADALKVLNAYNAMVSQSSLPFEFTMYDKGRPQAFLLPIDIYYMCDDKASAQKYARIAMKALKDEINYFKDLGKLDQETAYNIKKNSEIIEYIAQLAAQRGDAELANEAAALIGAQAPAVQPQQMIPQQQDTNLQQAETGEGV
jgi:hypothetical protein